MSVDIHAYIKDFNNATREGCEQYLLQQFNIKAQVHPESDFETDSGFLPFKVEFPAIDDLKGKEFISGFEIFTGEYDYQSELQEINKSCSKIAKKKDFQEFVVNEEVDNLLKTCNYDVTLVTHSCCCEAIMASAFASYLAETCNGVICDPQSGKYYHKNLKQETFGWIKQLMDGLKLDELHPFEGF